MKKLEKLKLIGVCLSTIHEEDRFNFIYDLNKNAVENGYRLIIFNSCADMYEQSPENNTGSSAVFKLIPYERLSALIIFPNIMYDPRSVDEIVKKCKLYDLPVISMDKEIEGCITFTFKNADIFEKLCCHVIEDHNAKNVFMIAGFKDNIYSNERIEAFKRALEKNDIPFEPNNISYGNFWEQPTIEVMDKWFAEEKRPIPDAIICANDFMAITASSYLQDMGVKVPEECIVTGFDGIKQTEYLPPQITTCKQDYDKMGQMIIETLIKIENGESVTGPVYVDFNIVYSQSCGCKPISYQHVSKSIRSLQASLRLADDRQRMIYSSQTSIPKLNDINFLPRVLVNCFKFDTYIFALNTDVFSPPDFGKRYMGDDSFSDEIDILYHRYNNTECEICRIPLKNLLPRYDLLLKNELPIIVCSSHFTDMVIGYCVFQPEIDIDEYEKMHGMMSTSASALGNFHNKMQIRCINDELQRLSQRDFLTGLYNRRGFFEKLEDLVNNVNHVNSTLVMISADLDELKYINDTFGHSEGDNAILTVSRALLSCSLQGGLCARFGGDEFCTAIIVNDDGADELCEKFKEDFLNTLNEYNINSNKPYVVKASIGCSYEIIDRNIDTDELIRRADEKMYAYKLSHKRQRQY